MLVELKLDHLGISEILKVTAAGAIEEATKEIADNVNDPDTVVEFQTTDRARGLVTVKSETAVTREAREGLLTRAAGAAGFQVRSAP